MCGEQLNEKQERQPFHDREQITNFLNYQEKITPIKIGGRNFNYKIFKKLRKKWIKENLPIRKIKVFLLEKRKIFQLEKGKHSNKKKKIIPIRKRKIFQLQQGKYSN